MEEWKEYRLGDFMQFNPKEKIVKGEVSRKIAMDQLVPFCRDVDSQVYEEYKGGAKFRNGDTIMARITPCLENGKTSYISSLEDDEVAFGSTEYIVLRNIEGVSDGKFVYYLSISPEIRGVAIKSMVGSSGRQRVQQDVLENYCISLPSLPTQQKIANILSSLDDKIEVNRRINEQLEELAQSLFNRMFFENKELDRLPLSSFANINPLRRLSQGTEARYIEMAALPTKGSFPIDWSYKPFGGGMKFTNGDTIMARITPCLENGKTAYIDFLDNEEIAFGSTEYIVISAKGKYCSALFYFLARNKEFVDYAVGHMNGSSGRQRVSGTDIANFPMPNISIEDSNKFAEVAMPIMDVIRNNSLENRNLTALRDTLLPKLMSGEIDVNEVEI